MMVEQCYYKIQLSRPVIHIRELLAQQVVNIDYRECKKCHGFNINCQNYITLEQLEEEKGLVEIVGEGR